MFVSLDFYFLLMGVGFISTTFFDGGEYYQAAESGFLVHTFILEEGSERYLK